MPSDKFAVIWNEYSNQQLVYHANVCLLENFEEDLIKRFTAKIFFMQYIIIEFIRIFILLATKYNTVKFCLPDMIKIESSFCLFNEALSLQKFLTIDFEITIVNSELGLDLKLVTFKKLWQIQIKMKLKI
ncbi:hypothetical protein BpHYR1_052244 [Brachionus plicatilis]|uniref:Uncharacterized protein n=1 Tax=Brachionus plicatilis TaxID=10195 RepID=A0A3M7TAG1_BRAPC|nr:hypothetical protein BpHYR1_052244 [Brachionus plicatilis]